jgi:hypothetical protein
MVEELDASAAALNMRSAKRCGCRAKQTTMITTTVGQQRQRNAKTLAMLECKAEDLAAMVSQIETMRVKVLAQANEVSSVGSEEALRSEDA